MLRAALLLPFTLHRSYLYMNKCKHLAFCPSIEGSALKNLGEPFVSVKTLYDSLMYLFSSLFSCWGTHKHMANMSPVLDFAYGSKCYQ